MNIFSPEGLALLLERLLLAAIVTVLGLVALRLSKLAIKRWARRFTHKKIHTITSMFLSLCKYSIFFIVIFTVLSIFGVGGNAIILAITGIGSVAIGFASQGFVKDVMTGTSILLTDQFNVGDIISIGPAYTGKVISLGLFSTRIMAQNGDMFIIPNSEIRIITKIYIDETNKHLYAFKNTHESIEDKTK